MRHLVKHSTQPIAMMQMLIMFLHCHFIWQSFWWTFFRDNVQAMSFLYHQCNEIISLSSTQTHTYTYIYTYICTHVMYIYAFGIWLHDSFCKEQQFLSLIHGHAYLSVEIQKTSFLTHTNYYDYILNSSSVCDVKLFMLHTPIKDIITEAG